MLKAIGQRCRLNEPGVLSFLSRILLDKPLPPRLDRFGNKLSYVGRLQTDAFQRRTMLLVRRLGRILSYAA